MTSGADALLRRLAQTWTMADRLPQNAVKNLRAAIAHAEHSIMPCGEKAAAVLLDRLWSIFPMPIVAADKIWNEIVSEYPADLVEKAINSLIKSRKWEKEAPLPAHLISFIEEELSARKSYLMKLRSMQARAKIDAKEDAEKERRKHAEWEANLTDDQRELLAKVRAARESGGSVADLIAGVGQTMPLHQSEKRRQTVGNDSAERNEDVPATSPYKNP